MSPANTLSLPWHDTLACARALLGTVLVRHTSEGTIKARIVETEAYHQDGDQAAHSFGGQTPRNAVMFGPPGFLYVYLIYGMHHCMNVVTEAEGIGAAVLIRALEPIQGVELMQQNRPGFTRTIDLTNGPAKSCQSLAVDRTLDGTPLNGETIGLEPGAEPADIVTSRRIGIRKSADLPWRFFIRDCPYVSRGAI